MRQWPGRPGRWRRKREPRWCPAASSSLSATPFCQMAYSSSEMSTQYYTRYIMADYIFLRHSPGLLSHRQISATAAHTVTLWACLWCNRSRTIVWLPAVCSIYVHRPASGLPRLYGSTAWLLLRSWSWHLENSRLPPACVSLNCPRAVRFCQELLTYPSASRHLRGWPGTMYGLMFKDNVNTYVVAGREIFTCCQPSPDWKLEGYTVVHVAVAPLAARWNVRSI